MNLKWSYHGFYFGQQRKVDVWELEMLAKEKEVRLEPPEERILPDLQFWKRWDDAREQLSFKRP